MSQHLLKKDSTSFLSIVILALFSIGFFTPSISYAQTISDFIWTLSRLIATAIAPLVAFALLTFFYAVIQYMIASRKSPDAAIKGRNVLLWGIIVLFVGVSVFGLVSIVRTTFGI